MGYSNNFFKPDKVDLAFVVFLLFIMLCNVTFCYDYSDLRIDYVSRVIASRQNATVVGYDLLPNHNYRLSVNFAWGDPDNTNSYSFYYGFTDSISNGSNLENISVLTSNYGSFAEIEFNSNNFTNLVLASSSDTYFQYFNGSYVSLEDLGQDMSNVAYDLADNVGISQFWNIFRFTIPFVFIVVTFVFGILIIKRLTKKESKGDIRF